MSSKSLTGDNYRHARIGSPMHAPEFDDFDYKFCVFRDLKRGTEVNPRAGMKSFSDEVKTVTLKPHEAILWGTSSMVTGLCIYIQT